MIAPIRTSWPSQSASTSISIAFSRKRSRKISPDPGQVPADPPQVVGAGRPPSSRSPSRGRRARTTAARAAGSPRAWRRRAPRRGPTAVAYGGLRRPSSSSTALKLGRSSARWIESTGGAEQRHAGVGQPARQLERGLAAELDDHPLGALQLEHAEHVLQGERLEVEPVGGVVVGRDRLRVAVDHHRVAARLAHGHRRVHAAVVELDALADAVGARPEDRHGGAAPVSRTSCTARRSQPE